MLSERHFLTGSTGTTNFFELQIDLDSLAMSGVLSVPVTYTIIRYLTEFSDSTRLDLTVLRPLCKEICCLKVREKVFVCEELALI